MKMGVINNTSVIKVMDGKKMSSILSPTKLELVLGEKIVKMEKTGIILFYFILSKFSIY